MIRQGRIVENVHAFQPAFTGLPPWRFLEPGGHGFISVQGGSPGAVWIRCETTSGFAGGVPVGVTRLSGFDRFPGVAAMMSLAVFFVGRQEALTTAPRLGPHVRQSREITKLNTGFPTFRP